MNWKRLQEVSRPHYYSIALDDFFPNRIRNILRKTTSILAIASFFSSFIFSKYTDFSFDGLFFLFVFVYLLLFFLESFYRSRKYYGLKTQIKEGNLLQNLRVDYSLSQIIFNTDEIDVTKSIFYTNVGVLILLRLGITNEAIKDYLSNNKAPLISNFFEADEGFVGLFGYLKKIYEADNEFKKFLLVNSISEEEFLGTIKWIEKDFDSKLREERFWSRENLGRIPSIGTSWSYGESSELGKFGSKFESIVDINDLDIENGFRDREVKSLETILERRKGSNAIIVEDDKNIIRDVVGRLVKKIKLGITTPSLENKNVFYLDWNSLTSNFKNKGELESELIKLLNQSVTAGNVIIYIEDIAQFGASAKQYGINLPSFISEYLRGDNLHFIASSTKADFHFFVETNPGLLDSFERIIPDESLVDASINPMIEQVESLEDEYGVIFTFPAILSLAKLSDKNINYGEMPSKAILMMQEIAPWCRDKGFLIIKEKEVDLFMSEKTGISTGEIKETEAQKIKNLESIIHNRVIGQNEAVSSIVSAIRRSRSGITNPKRPISSFLFLGPTGVGKTEVAKALAESFFGDENKMIRLDMSEFNGFDALGRLIGDFAEEKSGVLSNKIRENPYSVLLLDEFEKSAPDVLDLFLQIIDEGLFSDVLGKQVLCRNLIIIATSNAGSDYIWNTVKENKNLVSEKDKIIDLIIKDKVFKPELVNRFDGVVLFHPLNNNELKEVAKLMLTKLKIRLKEREIDIDIKDDLLDYLIHKGINTKYGGREINRIIQNEIEDYVAKKVVSGEVSAGSKIIIGQNELINSI